MPITLDEVGIQMVTDYTLLTEQSVERVVEQLEPMVKYDGTLADDPITLFDPTHTVELSGVGDLPAGLAVATDGGLDHEAITAGVTLLTRLRTGETADQRNTWSATFENCPGAAVAEV